MPASRPVKLAVLAVTAPTGFTLSGYTVTISPPVPAASQSVTASTASFTGLEAGTSYTLSVTATGTGAQDNPVQSYSTPLTAATSGSVAPLDGDISFLVTLNWGVTSPMPAGTQFSINGTSYTPSATAAPVTVQGSAGLNNVPLQMLNGSGSVVYSGNYALTLAGTNSSYAAGTPFLLAGNSQPLTLAGPPGTPPYNATNGNYLSVGTPFAPNPDKQVNAVVLPTA